MKGYLVTTLAITMLQIPCIMCTGFFVRPMIIRSENSGEQLKIRLPLNDSHVVVLDLKLNRNLRRTYKVEVQDEEGNFVPHRLGQPCQYIGTVTGFTHSLAVISTCSGLSGTFNFGKYRYSIRPVEGHAVSLEVVTDQLLPLHEVYIPPVYEDDFKAVGIDSEEDESSELKSLSKRTTNYKKNNYETMKENVKNLEIRFLELSVLIDKTQHIALGRDIKKTEEWTEEIINLIAAKYLPYHIVVALVQMRIFSNKDPEVLGIPDNHKVILNNTANYRLENLIDARWSDATVLITGQGFAKNSSSSGTVGAAYTSEMCDEKKSTNVNYDTSEGRDKGHLATIIAHEIGHLLGMNHDASNCKCACTNGQDDPEWCNDQDRCIMHSVVNKDYSYFSDCSRAILENLEENRCLFGAPDAMQLDPVCGNGIVEKGETCDCGSEDDCPILDPCCEIGTCQLKNTSSCFTGACCTDKCQFKPKGTVCRAKTPGKECDFEETCTGSDSACPVDTYEQNGRKCLDGDDNEGFCHSSDCKTIESQCRELFGNTVQPGREECFKQNTIGWWGGNCGGDDKNYEKCSERSYKCGLLHCLVRKDDQKTAEDHAKKLMGASNIRLGISTRFTDTICLVALVYAPKDEDEAEGFVDKGQVMDYTPCGDDDNMICLNSECVTRSLTPCPMYNGTECAGRGLCNNLNQCHCDGDWDSGMCMNFPESDEPVYKTIIMVLGIAVVLVPLAVGIAVYMIKHNFDLKAMEADRRNLSRRISTRSRSIRQAFSRQGSRASNGSAVAVQGKVKNSAFKAQYTRVSKVGTDDGDEPKKASRRAPEYLPLQSRLADKKKPFEKTGPQLRVPPPPPKPNMKNSPGSTPGQTPQSSTTRIDVAGDTPAAITQLRNVREGLRPARADARTHSESFNGNVRIPLNNLRSDKNVASDGNIADNKKPSLHPPKLLAGRSRESKKLQISGPASQGLYGLDGRPKSIHSAMDIKQSSDSINTVSSTRALFEPTKNAKSRWS